MIEEKGYIEVSHGDWGGIGTQRQFASVLPIWESIHMYIRVFHLTGDITELIFNSKIQNNLSSKPLFSISNLFIAQ